MNAYTRIDPKDASEEADPRARVGPNAITRMAEAMRAFEGDEVCASVFLAAELQGYLQTPPTEMVDEDEVSALHRAVFLQLGAARAARIGREAGRLTGDYLLANRIPAFAQKILRAMPRPLAARMLLAAVSRHAWTFAGSGRFSYVFGRDLMLTLEGAPVCRQLRTEDMVCHYFAGTFERLLRALVTDAARVEEIECEAAGAKACVFRVNWG